MELVDTIDLMCSSDYKDRFKAEFHQTKIRYNKLNAMIKKYEEGTLSFVPTCPLDILKKQARVMSEYLYFLGVRAQIEDIDLKN